MQDQIAALREALEKNRGGRKRWRCPPALRSEVVSYAQSRRASGACVRSIALDLGLSVSGLSRWMQGAGRFRQVRVARAIPVPHPETLTLVTPQGFRLEGLTPTTALGLLRNL